MTLKDELPTNIGAQYATREEWRNNSRKNEETEPKQSCESVSGTPRAWVGKSFLNW